MPPTENPYNVVIKNIRLMCEQYSLGTLDIGDVHHKLGVFQQEINHIMHPVQTDTLRQQTDAERAWGEFTRDQRVIDFCEAKHLTLEKGRMWYWCSEQQRKDGSRLYGTVVGLEGGANHIRGTPRITNGCVVWLEQEDGSMFLAHWDWFKKERKVGQHSPKRQKQLADINQKIAAMLAA